MHTSRYCATNWFAVYQPLNGGLGTFGLHGRHEPDGKTAVVLALGEIYRSNVADEVLRTQGKLDLCPVTGDTFWRKHT